MLRKLSNRMYFKN